nr:MAG TPA: hypothetical protein [Caudoviricetes sp.]
MLWFVVKRVIVLFGIVFNLYMRVSAVGVDTRSFLSLY